MHIRKIGLILNRESFKADPSCNLICDYPVRVTASRARIAGQALLCVVEVREEEL